MAKIKVKSAKEIELIRDAGALAAETLIRAGEMCKPGVSTLEIDEFIGDYTRAHKGISACMGYHGYPRYACISINEVVCHGIPRADTILKDGDIVNIDITTILSGYHGDTSAMFCVGKVSFRLLLLLHQILDKLLYGITQTHDTPSPRQSIIL